MIGKEIAFKNRDRFLQLGIAISTLGKMRGLSLEKLCKALDCTPNDVVPFEREQNAGWLNHMG